MIGFVIVVPLRIMATRKLRRKVLLPRPLAPSSTQAMDAVLQSAEVCSRKISLQACSSVAGSNQVWSRQWGAGQLCEAQSQPCAQSSLLRARVHPIISWGGSDSSQLGYIYGPGWSPAKRNEQTKGRAAEERVQWWCWWRMRRGPQSRAAESSEDTMGAWTQAS